MKTSTSSDVVRFRPARLADVESFRELRLEALCNHPTAFGQDYVEAVKRNQEYWIETLTINEESEALFLAEYNSQLIGMTGIFRGLSIKGRHSATVWGVYVKPGYIRSATSLLPRLGEGSPSSHCHISCGNDE